MFYQLQLSGKQKILENKIKLTFHIPLRTNKILVKQRFVHTAELSQNETILRNTHYGIFECNY